MSARLTKWEKAGLHRDAISSRTAVAGNRIVEGAHRGIRSAHRANRQGSVSRSCSAQTSERSRNTDWVDLHPDTGRSASLSPKSGCRMFSGVASRAQKLRYERTADAHQQGR